MCGLFPKQRMMFYFLPQSAGRFLKIANKLGDFRARRTRHSLLSKVALLCIPMGIWFYTLFAISHPQNTLLPFYRNLWFPLFLFLLVPWGIFDFFSSWRVLRGRSFFVEVLDSARTMQRPAEPFINQEQRGNCTRIGQCNGRSHAKISSTVMQDLSMPLLTPYVLVQPHSAIGDLPCMWNASSVK